MRVLVKSWIGHLNSTLRNVPPPARGLEMRHPITKETLARGYNSFCSSLAGITRDVGFAEERNRGVYENGRTSTCMQLEIGKQLNDKLDR